MANFSDNVSGIIDDIEFRKPYDRAILKYRFLDEINFYEQILSPYLHLQYYLLQVLE